MKYIIQTVFGFIMALASAGVAAQEEEAVFAGYGEGVRETLTGAVSSVSGSVLDKSPTNIFSETLYGRLPGLQINTSLSELTFFGYSNFQKAVRGISTINGSTPLIVIDGVVAPTQYIEFLTAKEIESVYLLKDASSTAIYGIQGANGALLINTKRGFTGKRSVTAYADYSVQQMTRRPKFINSSTYARLRNEAGVNDGLGAFSQYTQSDLDAFDAGNDPAYPNNDWFDMYIRDFTQRQRVGVSVAGGNSTFRYFSNIGFLNQESIFKINEEADRDYDPTPRTDIVNFRANMDIDFNKYVSGFMRLTGSVKREKLTGNYSLSSANLGINDDGFAGLYYNPDGTVMPYVNIFYQPPTMFGPVSPIIEGNEAMSNQVVTVDGLDDPVYGLLNRSGYGQVLETNVLAQTGLNFNLEFITPGLTAGGSFAYQTYSRNQVATAQDYQRVVRGEPLSRLDNFSQYKFWTDGNLRYFSGDVFFYYLNLMGKVNYTRRFGDHTIDVAAHTFYQYMESEAVSGTGIVPYKRQNTGLSAVWGIGDKYFVKADVGYSGSEQFAKDHRYVWTPAISAAWLLTKDDFSNCDALDLFKLRASYGITANDQLGGSRYLYLDNIHSDGTEYERGNPNLEAEKIAKLNAGFDLAVLQGFSLSFDWFQHKTDNMLIPSSSKIPEYQGIPLSYYPKLNDGKMENKGFEVSLGYEHKFCDELSVYARANFMQTRNKVINTGEAINAADYAYRYRTDGYIYGQLWGYLVDNSNGNGYFNSEEELASSGLNYSFGTPRVGDLKYVDLNGDGVIDERDKAPMGYSSKFPAQEYSLDAGATWRGWEFSLLLQGVNRKSFFLGNTTDAETQLLGLGVNEALGRGIYSDLHLNAWTAERYASGAAIDYPALSLTPSTNLYKNSFFLQNGAYLRLKNVEVAYTLPSYISDFIRAGKIRAALNAQNLLTFDKMKTDAVDPEIAKMTSIQPFRVYNLSLSINF
jgi:TonB-linked SusC/RagA family outer membrane protein